MTQQMGLDSGPERTDLRQMIPRTAYAKLAGRLQDEAERSAEVHVYLTAEAVAEALGDVRYDAERGAYEELREWVAKRRLLGFEPSADEILEWAEGRE